VSWPTDVQFAAHQFGESLTIHWNRPPCDQTNYISGYAVAYRKLTDGNCTDNIPAGRKCLVLNVVQQNGYI